jgi:hypothetical protein
MTGRAEVLDHRFAWETDFSFPWSGGWLGNQEGRLEERNLIVVIPGRDRRRAVIMADHYDTAYMEDVFRDQKARRAAAGADDNHSATATLLMAAEVLLPLARAGKLRRDVWLVHLTGEEFPSDCLGARKLAQQLLTFFAPQAVSREVSSWPAWVGLVHVAAGFGVLLLVSGPARRAVAHSPTNQRSE